MDVVVIIPAYNRATIIPATLESVAAQTVAPRQVIVVDDESSDDTVEVTERWFERSPRPFAWRIVRATHALAGGARNRGVAESEESPLVHFLDSDDLIPPDFYQRVIAAFREQPEAIAACADQIYTDRVGKVIRSRSLAGIAENAPRWFAFNDGGIMSNTVMRRELFQKFGPFPEHVQTGEDFHVLSSASKDTIWAHVPGQPVECRQLGDNISQPSPEVIRTWMTDHARVLPRLLPSRWERSWILSRRWVRTGNMERGWGDRRGALGAYLRALAHRPVYLMAWRRLISTALGIRPRPRQRKSST